MEGDSLLIATDFGIVVFDPDASEVRDTYSRLGTVAAGIAVRDVIEAPDETGIQHFWAATEGHGRIFHWVAYSLTLVAAGSFLASFILRIRIFQLSREGD